MASKEAGFAGQGRGRGRGKGKGKKSAEFIGKKMQDVGQSRKGKSKGDVSPYVLKKHPAKKPSQKDTDVYVNRTADFAIQMARCRKLFEEGHNEICIHGLGVAINRAINLALQLKETSSFPMEVNIDTSTVEVMDDLEPLQDDYPHQSKARLTSAVHIHLRREPLTEPKMKIVYSQQKSTPQTTEQVQTKPKR